jgi:hypothetical protein
MSSPPVLTPQNTTGFNRQTWADTIEGATYQRTVALPTFDEYPGRVLNQGNIRKKSRASASTLAQDAEGDTGLTASNITGTPVTLTPVGRYVYVSWSENEDAQVEIDLDAEAAGEIEQAMSEALDTAALANATTGTNIMSQAGFDSAMIRQAVGRLMGNTNGRFAPGEEPVIYLVASHTQYPNLMNIREFNDAEVRGDGDSPHVKGIWATGGGVKLMYTTVVTQDGNGWHNVLYVSSAFVVGWNKRTQVKRQDLLLNNRILVYSNMATAVKHDSRFIDLRTTASGL